MKYQDIMSNFKGFFIDFLRQYHFQVLFKIGSDFQGFFKFVLTLINYKCTISPLMQCTPIFTSNKDKMNLKVTNTSLENTLPVFMMETGTYYIGNIIERSVEEHDVLVDFMIKNPLKWPFLLFLEKKITNNHSFFQEIITQVGLHLSWK
jgi:hypothetical protein